MKKKASHRLALFYFFNFLIALNTYVQLEYFEYRTWQLSTKLLAISEVILLCICRAVRQAIYEKLYAIDYFTKIIEAERFIIKAKCSQASVFYRMFFEISPN